MSDRHWYASFTSGGAPHSRRLCRLPIADQWPAAIDLAIAVTRSEAGWRHATISATGERYWYWPTSALNRPGNTGWWLIPPRIDARVRQLIDAAERRAMGIRGWCDLADVSELLTRWRRSRRWQRRCLTAGDLRHYHKRQSRSSSESRS